MSDLQPPKLQPQHLFEKREKRDNARLKSYNQLLEQIQHRIFTTSQLPGNPNYLIYSVPPFILGLPSMDMQDCIVYLVFQLRQNGFEVRFTYPNLLYISWASYEKEYFMKKNPIVKAMSPPKPEPIVKKAKSVQFQQHQQPSNIQNPYTDKITVAPIKSASDYMPPTSFLDTIQRPLPTQSSSVSGAGNVIADLWKFT